MNIHTYIIVLNWIGILEYVMEAAKCNHVFLQKGAFYSTNCASIARPVLSADIKFKLSIWIRLFVG